MSQVAPSLQNQFQNHVGQGRWSRARHVLAQGGTCNPATDVEKFTLWEQTIGMAPTKGKKEPALIFQGWEFLLQHGATAPAGEWGLSLLAALLNSHPLIAADWVVERGLVLPQDARALPLVHGALGRAGFKALDWLSAHGVPLDTPHPELQPPLHWVVANRGRSALPWVKHLMEKGVRPSPWQGAPPSEPSTPLLKLAHDHALGHQRLSGRLWKAEWDQQFAALWDILVEGGEDPDKPGPDGKNALDWALQTPFALRHTAQARSVAAHVPLLPTLAPRVRHRP